MTRTFLEDVNLTVLCVLISDIHRTLEIYLNVDAGYLSVILKAFACAEVMQTEHCTLSVDPILLDGNSIKIC